MSRPAHRGTIFDVLRGLSPSRTRTGFGRMVATTLAVLISLLLVGSVGPVYADGSTGTSTDTTAATSTTSDTQTSSDTGTDPAAGPSASPTGTATPDASSTPSSAPSPSDTPSPTSTATGGNETTTTSSPMLTTALAGVTPMASTVSCTDVGGFEIDGNTGPGDCTDAVDWDSPMVRADGARAVDGFVDDGDRTGFTGSCSAENTDPMCWDDSLAPNSKSDIGTAYAYSRVAGDGHVYAFFGLSNTTTFGGTSQVDLEYNQLPNVTNGNGVSVPQRSEGDLLFRFSSTGNGTLSFADAKQYFLQKNFGNRSCFLVKGATPAGGWCAITIPDHVFASSLNTDGTFAEGAIDLTLMFQAGGTCSGNFGVAQMRSVTGNSFDTASMKDYVQPLTVSTPSTCATLKVQKQDLAGNPVGGATFKVSPNPSPGGTGDLVITDGTTADPNVSGAIADGKGDGVITISPATPDVQYTVTEVAAPAGYLLPAEADQTVTAAKSSTATLTFKDPAKWQDLDVSKAITSATYTRTYKWKLEKGVGDSQSGPFSATARKNIAAGQNSNKASFGYQIRAIEDGFTDSAWDVRGKVTITNPNSKPVEVNLSDKLADGTACSFASSTVSVPGDNQPHGYPFECSYASAPADLDGGTNTATVTWNKADYPQSQADVGASGSYTRSPTASYTWSQNAVHKTVTVTDDRYTFGGAGSWNLSYGVGDTAGVHSTTYSADVQGSPTACVDSANTATLTADDDSSYQKTASATATVCVGADLLVVKDASPQLTRTYKWTVTKDADSDRITTDANGDATARFTIHVKAASDPGYDDSDWAMTGAINVTNPNQWEDITLAGLTDSFGGAAANHQSCVITDWGSVSHVVPQNGSRTYHYSCTFDEKPSYDGTNTATASWDGTAAATPTSSADGTVDVAAGDWARTAVDDTANLYDDGGSAGATWTKVNDTPMVWSAGLDQEFHYAMPVHVDGGTCQQFTNQARVQNGGLVLAGPAGAPVTVCNELGLTASKTATATFERTYHWQLAKTIADASTVHIDGHSHTFGYTVTATPHGYSDGSFALSGSIHVANSNADKGIAPITATVTDQPTGVGAGVSCLVNGGDNTVELASGESVDLPYTCSFAPGETPSNGTNVAHITWNNGLSSVDARTPVAFTQTSSIDQSVQIRDDQASNTPTLLGTATWGDQPTSFSYSKEFTAPGTACADFTNHAWITALGATDHLADASATATICPNPGTWKVVKTSTPADGSVVDPGETITYHVTVTKTGGVDPTDVVVVDDLTDVVDHAGDPTFTAPAGTHAAYDASSHQLTWTIDQLSGSATLDYTVTVDQDALGATLVNHVTSTGSSNCPANPQQESDDCVTTHYTPKWTLAKSSAPATGAQVLPGDKVAYTLTVENTGPATLTGATVQDNLSDVLDNAGWNDDASTSSGSASLSGSTLTWALGSVEPGQSATLTYSVTVDDDADGATLQNVATPTTAGGSCATVGGCETTQHTPAWTLTKTSNPANHQQVLPGDKIAYTLTVENTGPATLTGATVQDNLAHVLDNAAWNDDATTSSGSASLDGSTLTWTVGSVEPGHSVTLTYSVTVDDDADGATLHNVATPTTPGGSCAPDECDTWHHTPEWTLTKTSDPASGATVEPGDTVTYTLTVDNTGPAKLKDAEVTDDLSDVLPFAAGGKLQQPLAAGLSVSGSTLTWDVPDIAKGGSLSVSYSVVVADGAWGVTLRNVATPGTPGGSCSGHCSTTHPTPHYTLSKTSDPATGSTVMPPYLGAAGTTITYTLTAVNDSDGVVKGATVTDDLSDVLDNATFDDSSIQAPGPGSASLSGDTLTWDLPTLQPNDTATVSYQVTVDAGQWNATLHNVTTPDRQGSCALGQDLQPTGCDTTQTTPSYTQLAVKKVDAETGAPLAGAVFRLATAAHPDSVVDTATSDSSGVAVFETKLQKGGFVVTETTAPQGYDLPPAGDDTMPVTIDGSNFVASGVMVPVEFRDSAQGQMLLMPKTQYRLGADGSWTQLANSDTVDFGDQIRYVVPVRASGPKLFHDVTVTDYVPGYNPADATSTTKASYVDGSATCTGTFAGCSATFDPATGLVTWSIGTVSSADGAVEFVVDFPQLPADVPYDANGDFTRTAANVAYLDWDEAVLPRTGSGAMAHHELTSNQVVATATSHLEVSPPPPPPPPPHHQPPHHQPPQQPPHGGPTPPEAPTLPNTGGPDWWYLPTGAGLVLVGAGLVLGQETRRRRRV